jgi:hypothetical protein
MMIMREFLLAWALGSSVRCLVSGLCALLEMGVSAASIRCMSSTCMIKFLQCFFVAGGTIEAESLKRFSPAICLVRVGES